jgi:hypothetical protein
MGVECYSVGGKSNSFKLGNRFNDVQRRVLVLFSEMKGVNSRSWDIVFASPDTEL